MSERFPTSAVSHASLDSDLYKSPLTAKHVEDGLADSAAKYRINNERFSRSHEAMQEERVRRELGDGAIRAYNGTRYEAQYTRQAEEAEEQAIAEGAARAYAARQRGESVNPGQAVMRKLQENDMAEKVLEGAGSTTVLNGAFASEIAMKPYRIG